METPDIHAELNRLMEEWDLEQWPAAQHPCVVFIAINGEIVCCKTIPAEHAAPHRLNSAQLRQLLGQEPVAEDSFPDSHFVTRLCPCDIGYGVADTVVTGIYRPEGVRQTDRDADLSLINGMLFSLRAYLQDSEAHHRRERLFHLTHSIYASIHNAEVLQHLYSSMEQLYPQVSFHIWLSHDYDVTIPYKRLIVQNISSQGQDENIAAFITGEPRIYEYRERLMLSVPMRGNQGVYGVLQMAGFATRSSLDTELGTVSMIADAVGIALENAALFQQSRRLVDELQIINEASRELSRTLDVQENIDLILSRVKSTFKPDSVHFLVKSKGQDFYIFAGTSVAELDREKIYIQENPLIYEVYKNKEPMYLHDTLLDEHRLFHACAGLDYRSVMVVPFHNEDQTEGMVLVTHTTPRFFSYDDFRLLQAFINHASLALVNSALHEELNQMVITDHLTRLYSRSYLDQEVMQSQNKDSCGSFILIDIDDFKMVNDTYGHQVGDDILIQIANVMKSCVRESDVAGRWGGEELAVYLPNCPLPKGLEIAERIKDRVYNETSPTVSISCGVSFWHRQDEHTSLESLFQQADKCLYQAKERGKNQVV